MHAHALRTHAQTLIIIDVTISWKSDIHYCVSKTSVYSRTPLQFSAHSRAHQIHATNLIPWQYKIMMIIE